MPLSSLHGGEPGSGTAAVPRAVGDSCMVAKGTDRLQRRVSAGDDGEVRPVGIEVERPQTLDLLHRELRLDVAISRHAEELHMAAADLVEALPAAAGRQPRPTWSIRIGWSVFIRSGAARSPGSRR